MERQKSKQPKLGDIVYYRYKADPKRGDFRPAIVTCIESEDMVSLVVFDLGDDPNSHLRLFSSVRYGKTEYGRWFWSDDLENPNT